MLIQPKGEKVAEYTIEREGHEPFDAQVYDCGNTNWQIITHGGTREECFASHEQPDDKVIIAIQARLEG